MEFPKLNMPCNQLRIRRLPSGVCQIWDRCRQKWLNVTPEEWVRQNFIAYLIENKNYPAHFIRQEYPVNLNGQPQRADILVFDSKGDPLLLVECKAIDVPITENVMIQVARYNMVIQAPYLAVTNGLQHRCFGKSQTQNSDLVPCVIPQWR